MDYSEMRAQAVEAIRETSGSLPYIANDIIGDDSRFYPGMPEDERRAWEAEVLQATVDAWREDCGEAQGASEPKSTLVEGSDMQPAEKLPHLATRLAEALMSIKAALDVMPTSHGLAQIDTHSIRLAIRACHDVSGYSQTEAAVDDYRNVGISPVELWQRVGPGDVNQAASVEPVDGPHIADVLRENDQLEKPFNLAGDEYAAWCGLRCGGQIANSVAVQRGWYCNPETGEPIKRNFGELVALMHSELSEALEADRDGAMDSHLPHLDGRAVEFADCIIRILDTCHALNIDVARAFIEKCRYNRSRADHSLEARANGGKRY